MTNQIKGNFYGSQWEIKAKFSGPITKRRKQNQLQSHTAFGAQLKIAFYSLFTEYMLRMSSFTNAYCTSFKRRINAFGHVN